MKTPSSKTRIAIENLKEAAKLMEIGEYEKTPISPLNKGTDWHHITVEQLWDLMHDPTTAAAIKVKVNKATSTGPSSPSKPRSSDPKPRHRRKPRVKGRAGTKNPPHAL